MLYRQKIPDPYKYMEDPNSDETKEFVRQQNEISQPYINSCGEKDLIKKVGDHCTKHDLSSCNFRI